MEENLLNLSRREIETQVKESGGTLQASLNGQFKSFDGELHLSNITWRKTDSFHHTAHAGEKNGSAGLKLVEKHMVCLSIQTCAWYLRAPLIKPPNDIRQMVSLYVCVCVCVCSSSVDFSLTLKPVSVNVIHILYLSDCVWRSRDRALQVNVLTASHFHLSYNNVYNVCIYIYIYILCRSFSLSDFLWLYNHIFLFHSV